jgi:DUF1680 family protein
LLYIGGALDDQETADDLSAAEYKVRVDGKIVIEPKEDIKERLGRSPGKGDALLLTFAFPVSKRMNIPGQQSQQGKALNRLPPVIVRSICAELLCRIDCVPQPNHALGP